MAFLGAAFLGAGRGSGSLSESLRAGRADMCTSESESSRSTLPFSSRSSRACFFLPEAAEEAPFLVAAGADFFLSAAPALAAVFFVGAALALGAAFGCAQIYQEA